MEKLDGYKEINTETHPSNVFFLRYLNYMIKQQSLNNIIVIVGRTGCQPKGSKVLMANGELKNIENIEKGDYILSPQKNGSHKYSKVLNTTNWFCEDNYDIQQLNRQKKKLYSCSYEHILPFFHLYNKRERNGKRKIINEWWGIKQYPTNYFSKLSKDKKSHQNIGISSFLITKFKDRNNCEIEPYTLGVFLGDGHFSSKRFNNRKNRQIGITTQDFNIIEKVSKHYPIINVYKKKDNKSKTYYFSLNSNFSKILTQYGLEGKKSGDKFIPKEALLSDSEYRKKLLAGLIDTDGYYKSGGYSITTKSKQLSENILFLVYSLGGRGNIRKVKKQIKKLNFEGEYYDASFYLKDLKLPIKTKRKIKNISSMYKDSNRVAIDAIKNDKKNKVYGFTLDSPSGWYITDNFMITHNSGKSYSGISLAEMFERAGISKKFDVSHIHFKAEDFIEHIQKKENGEWLLEDGDCIIFDEAGVAISSREWFSVVNKRVMNILETFRWRKLITIFTVPDLSFIDSKARRLVNMLFEPKTIIRRQNICIIKPLMLSWDRKKADKMYTPYHQYKNPIDGQIYKIQNLFLPLPSAKIRHEYDKKKEKYSSELTEEVLMDLKLLKVKQKLNMHQKKIFDIMHREKDCNYKMVSEILGLSEKAAYKDLKYIHYILGKDFNEEPPEEKKKD